MVGNPVSVVPVCNYRKTDRNLLVAITFVIFVNDFVEQLVGQKAKDVSVLQQSWFIPGKDDLFLASFHAQETGIGVNLQGDKQGRCSNKAGRA